MTKRRLLALVHSPTGVQFCRYSAVGFSGAVIDLGLYRLLTRCWAFWRTYYIGANTISFSCAVVNNFVWHKRWTFHPEASRTALAGTAEEGLRRRSGRVAPMEGVVSRCGRLQVGGQFVLFVVVSVIGLTLNSLILRTLSQQALVRMYLGEDADMFAKLVAIPIVWMWNFGANKFWTFRQG